MNVVKVSSLPVTYYSAVAYWEPWVIKESHRDFAEQTFTGGEPEVIMNDLLIVRL